HLATGSDGARSHQQPCLLPPCRRFMGSGEKPCAGRRPMKAVLFERHGGPEVLHLAEVPDPTAGPGEVVVDIHAASVNAADYKVRLGGGAYHGSGLKPPPILRPGFSVAVHPVP